MPFITEELWHQLPQRAGARSIALDRFPEPHLKWIDSNAEEQVAMLQELITAARNIRAEMKLDMKAKLQPQIRVQSDTVRTFIEQNIDIIERLANLLPPTFVATSFDSTKGVIRSCGGLELFVPYKSAFDVNARAAQLRKEKERLSKEIESARQRLADKAFRSRAPENIVKGNEAKLAENLTEFNKIVVQLAQLERL
jgi:valyl-tRNA synthetase